MYLIYEFYLEFNITYTGTSSISLLAGPESSYYPSDGEDHILNYHGINYRFIMNLENIFSLYIEFNLLTFKKLTYTSYIYGIYPLT